MINVSQLRISCLLLICASSGSFAGSTGEAATSYQGFWAGVGGSYDYSTLSGQTNITKVSSTPSSAEFLLSDSLNNHMAPVANAGYFFGLPG